MPAALLQLDTQLRQALVDEGTGLRLLGDRESGEFILGSAQPTLMPVVTQGQKRGITPHFDSPGYGDVVGTC